MYYCFECNLDYLECPSVKLRSEVFKLPMPISKDILCPQCWKAAMLKTQSYQSDDYVFHHKDAVKPVAIIMSNIGNYEGCGECRFGAWCITYSLDHG
jgi:hypothetical protein